MTLYPTLYLLFLPALITYDNDDIYFPITRYFFPRQLLIPHFWTPRQQIEFRGFYHSLRAEHHWPVLKGLENTNRQVKDNQLQNRLKDLCAKVSECIRNVLVIIIYSLANMCQGAEKVVSFPLSFFLSFNLYAYIKS